MTSKVYVAPAGTTMPVSVKDMEQWKELLLVKSLDFPGWQKHTPASELLWRLNTRLQGRDPGNPSHWRGM